MKLKYIKKPRKGFAIEYYILDSNGKYVGHAEGHVGSKGSLGEEELVTVVNIDPSYQKKGVGYETFKKIYDSLASITIISKIIGCWCKDKEFSHCEGGMSTNMRIFHKNIGKGLSPEESALNTPTGKWVQKLGYNKCKIKKNAEECIEVIFFK